MNDADKQMNKMSSNLAYRVQKRFKMLQNPRDCEASPKIVCDLNKSCGYGCQMHHVMYCFITAYFTNRTMILDSTPWDYNSEGYSAYFKPLSDSCINISRTDEIVDWNSE